MAAKWSAQSTKATPVAADTSLLIDSADGASKLFTLGNLSQFTNAVTMTGGILTNTIGERTASNNIIATNKMNIRANATFTSPQLILQGSTNTNKQLKLSYDTTLDVCVIESTISGSGYVAVYYNALNHQFQCSGSGVSSSITSAGLNVDIINEFTALAGVRMSSKVCIGGTIAPLATLTGFNSTILGVDTTLITPSTMIAKQMQLSFNEGTNMLTFTRKYDNNSTVKSYSIGPFV